MHKKLWAAWDSNRLLDESHAALFLFLILVAPLDADRLLPLPGRHLVQALLGGRWQPQVDAAPRFCRWDGGRPGRLGCRDGSGSIAGATAVFVDDALAVVKQHGEFLLWIAGWIEPAGRVTNKYLCCLIAKVKQKASYPNALE